MCDTGTKSTCANFSRSITVGTIVLSSFMADCLLPGHKTYLRVVPLPQKFLSSQRSKTPAIHSFGNGVTIWGNVVRQAGSEICISYITLPPERTEGGEQEGPQ